MEYIAFFDSGVGGLTVLKEAMRQYPFENYLYYADTEHVPYGTQDNSQIKIWVESSVSFLNKFPLKALVIACNTATSVAIEDLRKQYAFPIIGMEPAVKPGLENAEEKRVLVCATERTLKEEKLQALITTLEGTEKTDFLSLQELVLFAEQKALNTAHVLEYLTQKFASVQWQNYTAIVLGCTHFIYFKAIIRVLVPKEVAILDGNKGTVNHLFNRVEQKANNKEKGGVTYYESGVTVPPSSMEWFINQLD